MNRKILLLAGAMSALFAGKQATTSAPQAVAAGSDFVDMESLGAGVTIGTDFVIGHEQAPAKPDAQPAAQQKVVAQSPPMFPNISRHIIERPGRRKVKYGKNRWVILG
jgi:hypothetical protein